MASASGCSGRRSRRIELLRAAVRSYELLSELHWQESYHWPMAAKECMEQVGAATAAQRAAQRCRRWAARLGADRRGRNRPVASR